MPQLWTETMVSQYFWLVTVLTILYVICANNVLPSIALVIKARKALEQDGAPKAFNVEARCWFPSADNAELRCNASFVNAESMVDLFALKKGK